MPRKNPPKKPATSAALDRIAEALEGLPAGRRSAIEKDLLALDRRAAYGGAKRGPKPKLGAGETMTEVCVVKCSPGLKAEFVAEAEALGFDNVGDYFRELHRRHVEKKSHGR